MTKKTDNEKLMDSKDFPKIILLDKKEDIIKYGGNRMLIAPPLAYDEIIKLIPAGKLLTIKEIRDYLAHQYQADFTCPLTAGLFINIVARASEERGYDKTPYWRVLKKDGTLNEKFPGGFENQKKLLEAEGHQISIKGKNFFVDEFEKHLFSI